MKLGSLFDGSGGFPLAGAMCGIEPVWAAEEEPYPIAVTRSRFPGMRHLGDVCKINGAEIEPVDIITFGSPCQDMSVAGKRAGLKHADNGDDETTRSGLFMEAVRIIKEMRKATDGQHPRFALWENVHGAFSSQKGEDFRVVLEELVRVAEPNAVMPPVPKAGWAYADSYCGDGWSLAYRVFDAQYWGVPQRRRRIHLVADFRGECAGEVLFKREGVRGYFAEGRTPWKAAPANAQGSPGADDRAGNILILDDQGGQQISVRTDGKAPTLRAETHGNLPCVVENHPADSRVRIDDSGKVQTLTSRMGTGGGNVPMVMEPFCKSARPRSADDATVWKPAKVSNTLNTFDLGETRANELVVQNEPHPAVAYAIGNGQADQSGIHRIPGALNCMHDQQAAMYRQGGFADYVEGEVGTLKATGGDLGGGSENLVVQKPRYIVRRLTPTERARLQGFPDRWGDIDPKTEFTEEEYRFWLDVRNTPAAINGKQVKDYTPQQMLTWYNKLHTDSAEYKMWGNGIALPCALYVMEGIAEEAE